MDRLRESSPLKGALTLPVQSAADLFHSLKKSLWPNNHIDHLFLWISRNLGCKTKIGSIAWETMPLQFYFCNLNVEVFLFYD